jgi:hypothetical protein
MWTTEKNVIKKRKNDITIDFVMYAVVLALLEEMK